MFVARFCPGLTAFHWPDVRRRPVWRANWTLRPNKISRFPCLFFRCFRATRRRPGCRCWSRRAAAHGFGLRSLNQGQDAPPYSRARTAGNQTAAGRQRTTRAPCGTWLLGPLHRSVHFGFTLTTEERHVTLLEAADRRAPESDSRPRLNFRRSWRATRRMSHAAASLRHGASGKRCASGACLLRSRFERCGCQHGGRDFATQSTSAAITWSTTASALARISSSVASWIGCGTKMRRTSGRPSAFDCDSAASMKALDARKTAGLPWISNHTVSCTLHVVQDPQSASASMMKSHSSAICAAAPRAPAW